MNKEEKKSKKEETPKLGETELSEEDKEIKEKFDLLVERLQDKEADIRKSSFDKIREEVSGQHNSSVPKPLKFLSPHYDDLKTFYEGLPEGEFKKEMADLLSVLGIVLSEEGSFEAIKFAIAGSRKGLDGWGHEYLRSLGGEVSQTYARYLEEGKDVKELEFMIDTIVPHCMKHHEEPEAIDLLIEVEQLPKLIPLCNEHNYNRVTQYLKSCGPYAADSEDMSSIYRTCFEVYFTLDKLPEALIVAQKINDTELIKKTIDTCTDPIVKKQLCLILGRARSNYETDDESLLEIISYEKLSSHFKSLAKELDVVAPKTPEAVFKSHLEDKVPDEAKLDSHKVNLSITYANSFINCGFGKDTLILKGEENDDDDEWIWKNKESGQTAVSASIGMLLLWDIDEGFGVIDKYMESTNDLIRAGAYMAVGLVNSGIKNDNDPVFALLSEKLEEGNEYEKMGALMGLSFTYAGSCREEFLELINPMILDGDNSVELAAVAALVAGFLFLGSANEDCISTIV